MIISINGNINQQFKLEYFPLLEIIKKALVYW
jgi:hypothetical protein